MNSKVRVRFAPSPTGNLHLGGARTALFNYLFAKRYGGTFILRIEDTDELRSSAEFENAIFEGLRWLGLDWDEGPGLDGNEKGAFGPYFQSRRADNGIYAPYAQKLLAQGKAYECFCTAEELEESRRKAQLEKRPPRYENVCRNLTEEEKAKRRAEGRKAVIRFKMPLDGKTEFSDGILGAVSFENKLLYDFIMVKQSGYPTYNFACVIDDHLMEISDVIRGNDHLSNTAHQLNLYKALGWDAPNMMHLSMIHGPDGTKLSKRHGHTNVIEYEKEGFLPEAVRNYLALLGWSTPDSQQIFEKGELEQKFGLEGCQKNPAMFDVVKLKWMNGEYIRKMSVKELTARAMPFIREGGLPEDDTALLEKLVSLEHEKYKLLKDIPSLIDFFFAQDVVFDPKAVEKVLKKPGVKTIVKGIRAVYNGLTDFTEAPLEASAREFAKNNGLKAGQVFHPLRVSVSGRTEGPTLFKMIEYMGKDTVVKRLDKASDLCTE